MQVAVVAYNSSQMQNTFVNHESCLFGSIRPDTDLFGSASVCTYCPPLGLGRTLKRHQVDVSLCNDNV